MVTENMLDAWVRTHHQRARELVVELIARLTRESVPHPIDRRIPDGDSIGQPGYDGRLEDPNGYLPFVPPGVSYWEIGANLDAQAKATSEYRRLSEADFISDEERESAAFVFVTPLSGVRGWTQPSQATWIETRKKDGTWRDIRIIDGTRLKDWWIRFPAIELWLAGELDQPFREILTLEKQWERLSAIGDPPPLVPSLFLLNRDEAIKKLEALFEGTNSQLRIETRFAMSEVADFVAAFFASKSKEFRKKYQGRCLYVADSKEFERLLEFPDRMILVAGFDLGLPEHSRVLALAKTKGHQVIYRANPGGPPHGNSVMLTQPESHHVKDALEEATYSEERARQLSDRFGGRLDHLLQVIEGISTSPAWTEGSEAATAVIAELIGSWNESFEGDREAIERISGKEYGEWIREIQSLANLRDTPLSHQGSIWRVYSRFLTWEVLGAYLTDRHLDSFQEIAVQVLSSKNPKFELPPEERYAALIHGRAPKFSEYLRDGVANTLALLGSHGNLLASCTPNYPESIASRCVRTILSDADWEVWASQNDMIPLIAEASPSTFLDILEAELRRDRSVFEELYEQEGSGITGWNYMTGILWGLENLAWDGTFLVRVTVILGQLSAIDPGGNWANRPSNTLTTIFLPWLPQTTAELKTKVTSLKTLSREFPEIAWNTLTSVLPKAHSVSTGSHKPRWRTLIPEKWSHKVSRVQYWKDVEAYFGLAMDMARNNPSRLKNLIEGMDQLPEASFNELIEVLGGEETKSLVASDRTIIWNALQQLINRHKKYSDADWAMGSKRLSQIEDVASRLKPEDPALLYQRLFSGRDGDLYSEKGSYTEQHNELVEKRKQAIEDIYKSGGLNAVLEFLKSVESAYDVGYALGKLDLSELTPQILPKLLSSEEEGVRQFANAFVSGCFQRSGWNWFDDLEKSSWSADQIAKTLAIVPFTKEAWQRANKLLGENEHLYWDLTPAHPYSVEDYLEEAIDKLVQFDRYGSAINALGAQLNLKKNINVLQATNVLKADMKDAPDLRGQMLPYEIIEIIKYLQESEEVSKEDLIQIEGLYLPLLDRDMGTYPRTLEQALAEEPERYCEVIRMIYRSKDDDGSPDEEITEEQKARAENAWTLLHNWRIVPGTKADGSFDGESFEAWLDHVKQSAESTGHLDIALDKIGDVLIHSPADPEGLWIHRTIANALNQPDAEILREGFRVGYMNSRGVFTYTGGDEEKQIAADYRSKAEQVEDAGFHRLATTMKKLADYYEGAANRDSRLGPHEGWGV